MDFNYVELLKNPLWKEKRKAILFRDGKKCTVCGKKTTLEIHHTFYYKDYPAPWCYPNDSLLTVCRECHRQWHEYNENVIVEKPKSIKTKILKEGVRGKARKKRRVKRKGRNQGRPCKSNPYRSKPCLATSQAIRLGYRKNSWGKWVKT
jgi:hypothetical protein